MDELGQRRPVDGWSAVMAVLAGADPVPWKLGLREKGSSSGNLGRRADGGWAPGASGPSGEETGRRRGSFGAAGSRPGGSEGTPTPRF